MSSARGKSSRSRKRSTRGSRQASDAPPSTPQERRTEAEAASAPDSSDSEPDRASDSELGRTSDSELDRTSDSELGRASDSESGRTSDSESGRGGESRLGPSSAAPPPSAEAGDVRKIRLRIRRQDGPERVESRRWETFEIPAPVGMTVVGALLYIQRHPVTIDGKVVAPVAWDCSCLEERCGACTMLINGRARLACSAQVEPLVARRRTIVLEPLRKFPLVRDLVVDRARLFDQYREVRAWIDVEDVSLGGPCLPSSQSAQQELEVLDRCISCGACLEACPQYGDHSEYLGAAAIHQVRRLALHPIGELQSTSRLEGLMVPGGIADCGKAQNCVEVCPTEVPVVDSLQQMARSTSRRFLFGWLLG